MSKKCVAYAIYHGQCVGVFTCWDKVFEYTNGFPDAKYKGFSSFEEALISFRQKYSDINAEMKAKKAKKAQKVKYSRSSSNVTTDK
jgi:viroplasmin and RNaseH domain-containing protein